MLLKTKQFELTPQDNHRLSNLCGQLDENLHLIERHLAVEISRRGFFFKLFGPEEAIDTAQQFIEETYMAAQDNVDRHELDVALQGTRNEANTLSNYKQEAVTIRTSKMMVKPHTANQSRYLKRILSHDINFGIGPAGTGKTYLAVACAVEALEKESVKRLILVRPAVEAGESLGFLPGDLTQKVDPYLRPMYDALYELMGIEKVHRFIERNIIEIAPLAFMRGRTLNDAFIILDEAQNTTAEQMKMFLTRIGFNSTAVVTGDITQCDLPKAKQSGLRHVTNILSGVEGISFTLFDNQDVVRHPLVQKVVQAYEQHELETAK